MSLQQPVIVALAGKRESIDWRDRSSRSARRAPAMPPTLRTADSGTLSLGPGAVSHARSRGLRVGCVKKKAGAGRRGAAPPLLAGERESIDWRDSWRSVFE